jgi:hypothetical protein
MVLRDQLMGCHSGVRTLDRQNPNLGLLAQVAALSHVVVCGQARCARPCRDAWSPGLVATCAGVSGSGPPFRAKPSRARVDARRRKAAQA